MDITLIFNRIEKVMNEKKVPKMEFYSKIGMTNTGFAKAVSNKNIKISTLLKIAEVLETPIEYFLDEKVTDKIEEKVTDEFERKYYGLLEKYNACLEEKDALKSLRGAVVPRDELKGE